jgi:hypothetical protein
MSLESRFAELGMAHKLSPDQELVLAAAGLGLEQEVRSISQSTLNTLYPFDFRKSHTLNIPRVGRFFYLTWNVIHSLSQ